MSEQQLDLFEHANQSSEVKIWIDGSAAPTNPGEGTIGIYCEGKFRCGLKLSEKCTNNQMEYVALYGALKLAEQFKFKKINIYTDSKILSTTFNNKAYSGGANKILHSIRSGFIKKASIIGVDKVSVEWTPRESNTIADELTNIAHDSDVWENLEKIDKSEFISDLKSRIN